MRLKEKRGKTKDERQKTDFMLIGVTGGIGSGKSAVLREIQALGYPVYDTDAHAKRLICETPAIREALTALFGEETFADNVYQTRHVAAQVFVDPALLQRLNAIVHPAVGDDLKRWAENKPLAFVESAVLFEAALDKQCDAICIVTAPEDIRIERVIRRSGNTQTADDIRRRIQAQEANVPHAVVPVLRLDNDGSRSLSELADQLITFAQTL